MDKEIEEITDEIENDTFGSTPRAEKRIEEMTERDYFKLALKGSEIKKGKKGKIKLNRNGEPLFAEKQLTLEEYYAVFKSELEKNCQGLAKYYPAKDSKKLIELHSVYAKTFVEFRKETYEEFMKNPVNFIEQVKREGKGQPKKEFKDLTNALKRKKVNEKLNAKSGVTTKQRFQQFGNRLRAIKQIKPVSIKQKSSKGKEYLKKNSPWEIHSQKWLDSHKDEKSNIKLTKMHNERFPDSQKSVSAIATKKSRLNKISKSK